MNVWGIKSLEERKKGKNNYTGSSSSSLTNWLEWCYSFRCCCCFHFFLFLFFFIFKALTLSGARADDHLWPSCWDCIGFLRGTQQFFFFFLIFGVVFFVFFFFFSFFSVFTQDSRTTLPLEKKRNPETPPLTISKNTQTGWMDKNRRNSNLFLSITKNMKNPPR